MDQIIDGDYPQALTFESIKDKFYENQEWKQAFEISADVDVKIQDFLESQQFCVDGKKLTKILDLEHFILFAYYCCLPEDNNPDHKKASLISEHIRQKGEDRNLENSEEKVYKTIAGETLELIFDLASRRMLKSLV